MSAQPVVLNTGRVLVADGVVYLRELEEGDDEVVRIVGESDDPVAAVSQCLRVGARAMRAAHGSLLDPSGGFEIGPGDNPTAFASGTGWVVVSGPYTWTVSSDGTVGTRRTSFGFVPPGIPQLELWRPAAS